MPVWSVRPDTGDRERRFLWFWQPCVMYRKRFTEVSEQTTSVLFCADIQGTIDLPKFIGWVCAFETGIAQLVQLLSCVGQQMIRGSILSRGNRFSSSPRRPDGNWNQPKPLPNAYWNSFPRR
jgi:hypothetical protein